MGGLEQAYRNGSNDSGLFELRPSLTARLECWLFLKSWGRFLISVLTKLKTTCLLLYVLMGEEKLRCHVLVAFVIDGCPVGDLNHFGYSDDRTYQRFWLSDQTPAAGPFPPEGLTLLPELALNLLCSTGWVPTHTSAFASLMLVTLSL